MFKIAPVSRASPQIPWGSVRCSLKPPNREGLFAFGNRCFSPSSLALSPIFFNIFPSKVIYRFTPLVILYPPLRIRNVIFIWLLNYWGAEDFLTMDIQIGIVMLDFRLCLRAAENARPRRCFLQFNWQPICNSNIFFVMTEAFLSTQLICRAMISCK